MKDYNFWYYTLSTISQTLAALIALSATYVIFKLDQAQRQKNIFVEKMFRFFMILDYKINIHDVLPKLKTDNGIKELLEPINYLNPDLKDLGFAKMFTEERQKLTAADAADAFRKCHEYMNSIIHDLKGQKKSNNKILFGYLKYQQQYFYRMVEIKKYIFHRLKYSLLWNSITITLSLLLIPLCNFIGCYLYAIIFIIIVMAIYCIIYTVCSMWKISNKEI